MTIRLHRGDLPDLSHYRGSAAVDTETMGLDHNRDRLCVVQLSPGDGSADVVQIPAGATDAPNLKRLLTDPAVLKIFHFARFDLAALCKTFGVMPAPVYCTKIASRLSRTYTDKHGLKDLVRDVLGIELSKQQQLTDWGAEKLTEAQAAATGNVVGVRVRFTVRDVDSALKLYRDAPGFHELAPWTIRRRRGWSGRARVEGRAVSRRPTSGAGFGLAVHADRLQGCRA